MRWSLSEVLLYLSQLGHIIGWAGRRHRTLPDRQDQRTYLPLSGHILTVGQTKTTSCDCMDILRDEKAKRTDLLPWGHTACWAGHEKLFPAMGAYLLPVTVTAFSMVKRPREPICCHGGIYCLLGRLRELMSDHRGIYYLLDRPKEPTCDHWGIQPVGQPQEYSLVTI